MNSKKFFIFTMGLLFSSATITLLIIMTKLPTRSSADMEAVSTFNQLRQLTTIFHLDDVSNTSVISESSSSSYSKESASTHNIPSSLNFNFSSQQNNLAKNKVLKSTTNYIEYSKAPIEMVQIDYGQLQADTPSNTSMVSGCKVPPEGFKSWSRGVVTKLIPDIHANCTLLFEGDELEVKRVQNASNLWPIKEHILNFTKWVKEHINCTNYKIELEDNVYITKDEVRFPLAFSLIVHNSPFQVFRLLKVIYRPHNIYCIHYDVRTSTVMKQLFNNLATCFDNIIIPNNIMKVRWGHHSLMEAQMNCFRDLLTNHHKYPWHYVITLCGKELPLRTNREIVLLLKTLRGTSAVRAFPTPQLEHKRYERKWIEDDNRLARYLPTQEEAGPIPYNLTIYKSMVYFALTPGFVNYVLNDTVAVALSKFLRDAYIPEEHFYSTLFMIPGKLLH